MVARSADVSEHGKAGDSQLDIAKAKLVSIRDKQMRDGLLACDCVNFELQLYKRRFHDRMRMNRPFIICHDSHKQNEIVISLYLLSYMLVLIYTYKEIRCVSPELSKAKPTNKKKNNTAVLDLCLALSHLPPYKVNNFDLHCSRSMV